MRSGSKSSKLAMRASMGTAIVTAPSARALRFPRPNASSAGRRAASGKNGRRPSARQPVPLGDGRHAVGEQAGVAAELVDDEADDGRRVLRRERRLHSENLREYAAAIDVADKRDRALRRAREAHVGDVALAQVDLRRAACAFDQHQIGAGLDARVAVEHGGHQLGLQRLIFARPRVADRAALNDDLRADLALRLQQDRIHVDAWGDACRRAPAAPARGRSRRRPPSPRRCSTCSAA